MKKLPDFQTPKEHALANPTQEWVEKVTFELYPSVQMKINITISRVKDSSLAFQRSEAADMHDVNLSQPDADAFAADFMATIGQELTPRQMKALISALPAALPSDYRR